MLDKERGVNGGTRERTIDLGWIRGKPNEGKIGKTVRVKFG